MVLGVCGGIAAYKAVEVCRRLTDAGALVSPVLTEDATRFVGELTFSALAAQPARTSLWASPEPIPHTRLGQAADLVVVAPATARVIGAYTAGISDDLLTATLLATRAPVVVCPAMHTEMWEHPAVQDNLATLRRRGVTVVDPGVGRLAGGDAGPGRLAEPGDIVAAVAAAVAAPLRGVRAVVTAGGTREPIDAVRFVGNRSSGKQGYAVAAELARRGAEVTLITTVAVPPPPGVRPVEVETAEQLGAALDRAAPDADVVVMAAAVADFRPVAPVDHKIKKADGVPEVVLERTPDLLARLGRGRRPGQVLVGFAAETPRPGGPGLVELAAGKLAAKGVDLVVANDVSAPGAGFGYDTNTAVVVGPDGVVADTGPTTKAAVAAAVVDAIADRLATKEQP